jgi:hypothetical protein
VSCPVAVSPNHEKLRWLAGEPDILMMEWMLPPQTGST